MLKSLKDDNFNPIFFEIRSPCGKAADVVLGQKSSAVMMR
jgi:hypothetical protein